MKKNKIFPFIFFLVITFLAAFIGSYFTTPNIESWYQYLKKPSFAPPNWLFAPVWTILYILMAISAFLVYKNKENPQTKCALTLYFSQLILNSFWSILFFGLKNPQFAFFEIIVLWTFILLTTIKFFRIYKLAGLLFLPYLFWVSFASVLNFLIWQLNS